MAGAVAENILLMDFDEILEIVVEDKMEENFENVVGKVSSIFYSRVYKYGPVYKKKNNLKTSI